MATSYFGRCQDMFDCIWVRFGVILLLTFDGWRGGVQVGSCSDFKDLMELLSVPGQSSLKGASDPSR